ncbi:uncharacterized protein LOC143850384 [Tasmannia lanceolata]|uniref:uncharacterized protein LOC143850384 n=1 Tax=Tasmannia lanceolata TaxID=3420 RepID=UPI0040636D89
MDMANENAPKTLRDRFYPARTAQPSCICLPAAQGNNFELKSQFITLLPHFHGLPSEDAYIFLREFEEVCVLIKMQQLSDDALKLIFITFSLNDGAKKWLYGLPTNSITTWEEFTVAFLKKFFPMHKTNKLRNDILQFRQKPHESFSKFMKRIFSKSALTTDLTLGICAKLFVRTREWESTQESERPTGKGFFIEGTVAKEAHVDSLIKRLEAIVVKGPSHVNQQQEPSNQCNAIYAMRNGCEYLEHGLPLPNSESQKDHPIEVSEPTPPLQGSSEEPRFFREEPSKNPAEEEYVKPSGRDFVPKAPFPKRLQNNKKGDAMDKILDIFKQVQVNIPLLDVISQVPSYAKKDPNCPTISRTISNTKIDHALLDLGASVNLLPYTVYQQLGLGELKSTTVTLQLVDRSVKTPKWMVEDVLVKVGEFLFYVDFIVLDTQPVEHVKDQIPIILGRPFLHATSNALINCRNGLMKLSFGNTYVDFNVFRLGKQPNLHEEKNVLHSFPEDIITNFEIDFSARFEECLEQLGERRRLLY